MPHKLCTMKHINLTTLSKTIAAYQMCYKNGNKEWEEKHYATITNMLTSLPHGSGIDNGVKLDWDRTVANKIIFTFEFHHMNEAGYYDGWTAHNLVITPTFDTFDLRITGRDRNNVKEYLYQIFYDTFTTKYFAAYLHCNAAHQSM